MIRRACVAVVVVVVATEPLVVVVVGGLIGWSLQSIEEFVAIVHRLQVYNVFAAAAVAEG